ncbi:MAG: MFS transporter [Novosphingobium sp.]
MSDDKVEAGRTAGIAQGVTLVLAGFLPILAIVTLTTAVPSIVQHYKDVPNVGLMVPLLVSAPGLTIGVLALFAGILVDKFGRRPLMVGATLLYGFAGAAPFLLEDLNAIIASRLLLGVAEAAILTIVNTLIADYWDGKGRRRWLTIQGIAGPILATSVITASGYMTELRWNGVFLVYLVALPLFLAMYLFIFEPTARTAPQAAAIPAQDEIPGPFPWGTVASIGAITLFAACLYFVWIIQGGLAFNELGAVPPAELGRIFGMASLSVPVGALLFGFLSARFSSTIQLTVLFTMLGTGLFGIGAAPGKEGMIAALLLQQAAAGMAVPTLITMAQSRLPFAHRGRGMGMWASAFFLGQFVSPFFVNFAHNVTGTVRGAFVCAGIVGLVAAAVTLASHSRRRAPEPLAA